MMRNFLVTLMHQYPSGAPYFKIYQLRDDRFPPKENDSIKALLLEKGLYNHEDWLDLVSIVEVSDEDLLDFNDIR